VAFSGLAVAIGLVGLLFFRGSYLASLGIGGTVVVALAVMFALTFLPALLGVLGPRVLWGRFRLPGSGKLGDGFWRGVAMTVMSRPLLVLLPTLALLLGVSQPFFKIRVAIPDVHVLPTRSPVRQGDTLLREVYPERTATRIAVVVRFPGPPLANAERVGALYDLSRRIAQIPGVDHVESLVDADPLLDRAGYQQTLAVPREQIPEGLTAVASQTIGTDIALLAAVTEATPSSETARAIVRAARRDRRVADGELFVTGATAFDLDSAAFIARHTPAAIVFVVIMTVLVLFFLLGSIVLPLKAVVMNFLSITGSFGALVWIFQEGHLHTLLGFTPGPVEPSLPIIMFCAVFGLSMDYEVLLLTRMQEEYERSHDNTRAVAEGLERSGRLITSAAAIMVVVFAAFVMTEIVLLKAVGLGMAIAVALDATVVRLLVVPATMRLFGDLNWWAPKFLARFQQRFRPRIKH
jgi:RND superfamily putative drug exporter